MAHEVWVRHRVHPRMVERLQPPAWGYLNVAEPPQGWADYFATPDIPAVRGARSTRPFLRLTRASPVVLCRSVGLNQWVVA